MVINFITGVMGAGKTEQCIEDYNYYPNALVVRVALKKPNSKIGDTQSRNGKMAPCLVLDVDQTEAEVLASLSICIEHYGLTEYLLIDEAQFLNHEQINAIENAALIFNIKSIVFYGLMSDFKGRIFDGAEHLLKIVDNVFTIPAECSADNCSKDAVFNARIVNGIIVKVGKTLVEEKSLYQPLCAKHYLTIFNKQFHQLS